MSTVRDDRPAMAVSVATPSVSGWLLSVPIGGYQRWISPLLPARCRFYPSCSAYAVQALRTRGPVLGLLLTGWRLLRCQPFNRGGYDPVPARRPAAAGRMATRRTRAAGPVTFRQPHRHPAGRPLPGQVDRPRAEAGDITHSC